MKKNKDKLVFNDDIKLYLGISEVILAFDGIFKRNKDVYLNNENDVIAGTRKIPASYFAARINDYINTYKENSGVSIEETKNIYKFICDNFKKNKLTLNGIFVKEKTNSCHKIYREIW